MQMSVCFVLISLAILYCARSALSWRPFSLSVAPARPQQVNAFNPIDRYDPIRSPDLIGRHLHRWQLGRLDGARKDKNVRRLREIDAASSPDLCKWHACKRRGHVTPPIAAEVWRWPLLCSLASHMTHRPPVTSRPRNILQSYGHVLYMYMLHVVCCMHVI